MDADNETTVRNRIASMKLTPEQAAIMRTLVDDILTDSIYTFLLGLDGAANIGGIQQVYQIRDEQGNLIAEPGDLETEAWEQFHGDTA
jgi:hypothetical protein